ncbi:hypothetical protein, partial [Shewanella surugensis]
LAWMAFIIYILTIEINEMKETQTAQTTPLSKIDVNEIKKAKAAQTIPLSELDASSYTYQDANNDVGCDSKYTENLQRAIFQRNYQNKWFIWYGIIEKANSDFVDLDVDNFGSADISVKFADPDAGTMLMKGDRLTIRFQMKKPGGCILPFRGKNAQIINL